MKEAAPVEDDPWLSFDSEAETPPPAEPTGLQAARAMASPAAPPAPTAEPPPLFSADEGTRKPKQIGLSAVVLLLIPLAIVATAGGLLFRYWSEIRTPPPPAAAIVFTPAVTGTATLTSRPDGAHVIVDGTPRGRTPLQLTLPVGKHTLELQQGTTTRSLTLSIAADKAVSQDVDFPVAATATTGQLEITSDPPGAAVIVDAASRGVTPLVLSDVSPGSHTVVIRDGTAAVTRTVHLVAGGRLAIVAAFVR